MPNTFNTGFADPLSVIAGKWYRQMNGGTPEEGGRFANAFAGGLGSSYDVLQSDTEGLKTYLGGVLGEGALPAGAMGNIQRNIGRVTNRNINTIREGSAQSGFRGVVDPNAINDAYANEAGALGNAELDLMKLQYARKSDAVAQLLGIANMGQGAIGADRSTALNAIQIMQGGAVNMDKLEAQKDAQPSAFGQIVGGLLTGVGTLATGGAFGAGGLFGSAVANTIPSDKRMKEKIVYTGETHDGLPVADFNYIGSPARYRGFIAQDVEDLRPDCVTTVEDGSGNGIMTVNYKKLGFEFRRVG